jgi:hypothetical protein
MVLELVYSVVFDQMGSLWVRPVAQSFQSWPITGSSGGLGVLQGLKMAFGKPQVFYIVYAETMERNNLKM